jgi:oligopeptide/dipeptide ABC transporter ATP-binding protein
MTALLEANSICKIYNGRASASPRRGIHSITLTLRAGEILGLVGESGCGKSTLAKVLVGLEQADAGSLLIDGRSLFGENMRPVPLGRRPIQMIFQDPYGSLNPRMRVSDLVAEGLRIERRLSASEIRSEVQRHLQLVGLGADSLDKYPHEFSGGQRQRICIARALILSPKVLIADEAVSALDVSVQMQILNLLLDLRETLGLSILFISHAISVIEYLCDRVAVMYAGRIVEENQTSALLDNPRHPYTAHLCAARPDVRRPADSIASPSANRPVALGSQTQGEGCVYAARCLASDALCHAQEPRLEHCGNAAFACFHPLASHIEAKVSVGN